MGVGIGFLQPLYDLGGAFLFVSDHVIRLKKKAVKCKFEIDWVKSDFASSLPPVFCRFRTANVGCFLPIRQREIAITQRETTISRREIAISQ